ncbi:MAG: DUF1349 domain-containing protein [Spirochaetaceae bacterium]|nr:MAG: DUF1349 domain-containing protein [Spirochaetaceae bacterium]
MQPDLTRATWLNEPAAHTVTSADVRITTDPGTDFWQRTYYGFRNTNAHALLWDEADNITLTVRVRFDYRSLFDQCGVAVYVSDNCWFKASIEYHDALFSRLGSVVTNHGYSDWATVDIPSCDQIWYRLSRRGPDFLIESSLTGTDFTQMRIFHLADLGDTTPEMGHEDPPRAPSTPAPIGLYACSPLDSSFSAVFDRFTLEPTRWASHHGSPPS